MLGKSEGRGHDIEGSEGVAIGAVSRDLRVSGVAGGRVVGGVAVFALMLCLAPSASAQEATDDDALRARLIEVAGKVVFPERCGECHAAELEVWEQTAHATGFDTLHTTDRAKEVYRAMGLRLIKRGTDETTPACLECHYTPEVRRDTLRAGAGVTCESCHGPARDWVGVHNEYGVAESDFQQAALRETPEHRQQRVADSRTAGMRRPSDLYDVAANCFGCHTVPREELVNVAGHTTGSDFELVDWSEQIRHNFLESYKTADGRTNAERSAERKRVMYVVGRALDVEYSLRGVAVATEDELYFAAMADRAGGAIDELYYLNDTVAIPAVQTVINLFDGVELKPNNRGALLEAADSIQTAVRSFIAASDGGELAAVDPFWDPDLAPSDPGTTTGQPAPERERPRTTDVSTGSRGQPAGDAGPAGDAATEPADGAVVPTTSDGDAAPSSVDATTALVDATPVVPVEQYDVLQRPPWRDAPAHGFVKVPCGKCHTQQQAWWQKDTHKGTAEPLRNGDADAARIAALYGIDPGDMANGSQTCMWCHGTIVAAPSRKVRPGVGCQRCHGAGADYLEPHETERYAESVQRGLTDLKTPAVRAATCAGCHYITDAGLLAAGHGTGAEFDVLERMDEIRHWGPEFGRETADMDRVALSAAHAVVIEGRGAPPVVELRSPVVVTSGGPPVAVASVGTGPATPPTPSTTVGTGQTNTSPGSGVGSTGARAAPAAAGRSTAVSPRARTRSARTRVALSPSPLVEDPRLDPPDVDPGASPEETLLQLKTRLEALYRALGRAASR